MKTQGIEAKKINAVYELIEEVGSYKTGAELWELLNFIRKFPKMSPFNLMPAHIQKPGSRYVATPGNGAKSTNASSSRKRVRW